MHRTITPVALSLTSLALLISALLPGSSSAAPLPHAAARPLPMQAPSAATLAAPSPAVPFQALGFNSDLTVVSTTQLLSVATPIQGDCSYFNTFETNGLAVSPTTGVIWVACVVFNSSSRKLDSILGQLDWNTGNMTTIGTLSDEVIVDIAFDGSGNLYGLTDSTDGTDPHALLSIDTTTAAATVVKVLDTHGGGSTFDVYGGLAFNPVDGNLYYANRDSSFKLFIDKLTLGTFAETTELSGGPDLGVGAMAFAEGKLWINAGAWYYANATSLGAGLTSALGVTQFPTVDPFFPGARANFDPAGIFPSALPCTPLPTAACLGNRFKVEVNYDATPRNGSGPGNVVLESAESVKFTFFDPANIEMILKILDACTLNHKWWVFAGGLTNVGVTIKVTDTSTGAVKNYSSSKNKQFQAFSDTIAFPCP